MGRLISPPSDGQVYEELQALWRETGKTKFSFTVKAFAERFGGAAWELGGEGGIGSCLKVLDFYGTVQRVKRSDRPATVRLLPSTSGEDGISESNASAAEAARLKLRGRQKAMFELLETRSSDEHESSRGSGSSVRISHAMEISPEALGAALGGLERAQVLAALKALAAKNLLRYDAPEATGGVELLLDPQKRLCLGGGDRSEGARAHADVDRRQGVELEKLGKMVAFAGARESWRLPPCCTLRLGRSLGGPPAYLFVYSDALEQYSSHLFLHK